jgi:hypothetical protein
METLLDKLDAAEPVLNRLDSHYNGEQPLAYLAPEAKIALGNRFGVIASNLPRLAVTSLAERLRVTGFAIDGQPSPEVWAAWLRNDLDQLAPVAHREALALGSAYVTVWADRSGRAQVSVESARQMACQRDPASREVVAALKRWTADGRGQAVLYEPEVITRYVSAGNVPDIGMTATTTFPIIGTGWTAVESLPNPFGVVPVVPLVNGDRLLDLDGRSEIADLIPLCDALNKIIADTLVSSEYFARPRRWAT